LNQIRATEILLKPNPPFHFEYAAHSHGWSVLSPNMWFDDQKMLQRTQQLNSGKVVILQLKDSGDELYPEIIIKVNHSGQLSGEDRKEIIDVVRHMLRLDEDFSSFYEVCSSKGDNWLRLSQGMGRLLRSPTLFEDIVKTICTTNIQWGGTKRMVNELVNAFGKEFDGNSELKSFPAPEAIAAVSLENFSELVRMGYRGEYVYSLAEKISNGAIDIESFFEPEIPTAQLKKKLLSIKGVGNYAAATLLMLIGRYDELPVDTVFREFVGKKYFAGKVLSDKEVKEIYADWGKWKYLAYWFDIWEASKTEF
jgi:3-methyladenine DNA glycosylase/8-oxoguanine DNA glycosylase